MRIILKVLKLSRETYLFKSDSEIDVNNLAGNIIQENVRYMPIPQAQYMSNNRGRCHAPGVLQPHGEPGNRSLVSLCEVVAHDRLKLFFEKLEMLDKGFVIGFQGWCQFFLFFAKLVESLVGRQVVGPISGALD